MSKKHGGAKKRPAQRAQGDRQLIVANRKARHQYSVLESLEVGLVLLGSEVKSLRSHDVQWGDAHARIDERGECWLYGLHVGSYAHAGYAGHLATQPRKLLLHRREIAKLAGRLQAKGLSLVPLQLYFLRGRAKMELALVQGKTHEDKRKVLVDRVKQREIDRAMSDALRRR